MSGELTSERSAQVKRASQSANQPTNQQTNQPINRQATNQSTNQATNQPISRPTNHGADLANYFQNKRLRPPLLSKFIVVVTQCNGDFPIFIGEDEEEEDEGTKSFFKIAQSQICKS